MNLQEYNSNNLPAKPGRPSPVANVTILKNGQLYFNAAAVKLLGLTELTKLSFSQDKDEPKNWYVHKSEKGFKLFFRSAHAASLKNKDLVTRIIESLELKPGASYIFLIAAKPALEQNGVKIHGLLYRIKI